MYPFYNGNLYWSILPGHSVKAKKKSEAIKKVLDHIQYDSNHKRIIWVDLKMVNFLFEQWIVTTVNFFVFFGCEIFVQKATTEFNENEQNVAFLELVS